jgi:hypothetical protein
MTYELTLFFGKQSSSITPVLGKALKANRLQLEYLIPPPASEFFNKLELFAYYGHIMAYDKAVALCEDGGLPWPFDPLDKTPALLSLAFNAFFKKNPQLYNKAKSMSKGSLLLEDDWRTEHWGCSVDFTPGAPLVESTSLITSTSYSACSYLKAAFQIANTYPDASFGFLETSLAPADVVRHQVLFVRLSGEDGNLVANFKQKNSSPDTDWRIDPPEELSGFLMGRQNKSS